MTTRHTMTDTTRTAKLPACGRREWIITPEGERFVCKPPTLPDLPAAELLKRPELFCTRAVSPANCQGCIYQEPVMVRPKSRESSEQHPEGAPVALSEGHLRRIPPTITDDGTIIYQKEGWEPPPVPPGYRRQSEDLSSTDAWVLVRETPLCKHVVLHRVKKKSCGCTSVIFVCTHRGKAENISGTKCDSCPHQETRDA